MKTRIAIIVILFSISLFGENLHAQTAPANPNPAQITEYCQSLANGNQRADALRSVCEFALTVQQKLPNYICDERIKRWADPSRSTPTEVIQAEVTVESGRESYSKVRINGRAGDNMLPRLPGMLSAGEFGMQWGLLFAPKNKATFKFKKEVKLNSRPAFLFSFEVREDENKSFNVWDLNGKQWNPGYSGSMWVEKSTLRPVRLELLSTRVPASTAWTVGGFVFERVAATTEYGEIPLADGSTFLLPITSSVQACGNVRNGNYSGIRSEWSYQCIRNDLEFTNCHKFGAKTEILTVE